MEQSFGVPEHDTRPPFSVSILSKIKGDTGKAVQRT